jgi:ATP-dependent DNA helicase PIF1
MTQAEALAILKTGANVFLTGEPGSGKSHTIRQYTAYLRTFEIEPSITASTGIAATHIGGMTIHAWCGIGVKSAITDSDLDAISQKEKVVRRVTRARVLIIDEISMLSSETLDSVDAVCRTLRNSSKPFGGLQVIFVGDFFQLPPVVRTMQKAQETLDIEYEERSPFAFGSSAWKRANPLVCYLSEQHRQEDPVFLELLTAVRSGQVSDEARALLTGRNVEPPVRERITKLYSHNADVDRINEGELARLPGGPRTYYMRARGAPPLIESLKRNCLSPETLVLKIGAKIIFTKNDHAGTYYNGTTGEVIAFNKISGNPKVRVRGGREFEVDAVEWALMDGNKKLAEIEQLPLRLAWAITVHKSQGMSLDSAHIDLSRAFEYGQGYVALSRVRTLDGLYLAGFNNRALEVHPEVAEVDAQLREASDAAADAFERMPEGELSELHTNFVRACGGVGVSQ